VVDEDDPKERNVGNYASGTSVPADQTKADIERTLRRYGAEQFAHGWDADRAYIAFKLRDRFIKFVLSFPDRNSVEVVMTPTGKSRTESDAQRRWEQAVRQKWRALLLVIKAKLESVDGGIETIEEAFLPQIVLPDGSTVGHWAQHAIPEAYERGKMPGSLLRIGMDKGD
jgi:hypothetical protein